MSFDLVLTIFIAVLFLLIGYILGKKLGALRADKLWQQQLPSIRADASKRSRSVLQGQFSEQLAPFLPDFPFKPSECKFLGKPVDFIVFEGLEDKNITNVTFVEVKTGQSQLSGVERSLRDSVKRGKVSWQEYGVSQRK